MMRSLVACLVLAIAACQPAGVPEVVSAPEVASAPNAEPPTIEVVAPSPVAIEAPLFSVADGQSALPAPFAGRWDASPEACNEEYSDMRLVVDARNMRFWESDASPTKIEQDGVNAIVIEADLSGEGDTWTDKFRMALVDAGETLMIGDVKRVRCKAEK